MADRMWRDFRNFPNESRDAGAIARREWRALRCAIRDPLVLATLGVAVLFGCGLWATGGVLGHDALLGSDASYSLAWDLSAARNFLTYAGWTVKIFVTTLRSGYDVYIYDTIQPQVFVAGASLIFAALAGLWIPALRRRGWMVACTTYAAFLLPAIPLGHHTFHYYLYPALAGAAWGVAAIADLAWRKTPALTPGKAAALAYTAPPRRLAERRTPSDRAAGGPRTLSWLRGSTAILTVMGLTWNGAAYMHHLESSRLPDARLPTDPTLRRQLIARHVRDALLGAHLPAGTRLYFWSPASLRMDRALGRAARSGPSQVTLWERNVEAALEGELGVRVLLPAVQQVKFVHSYELAPAGVLYAIYDVDGTLELMPAAQIELYAREQRGGR